jgi:phosphoglycolate phosphatase
MLFNILENLAIVAQNALMIGDTIYDMDMARAAHMPALAVSYGLHNREHLLQSGALGVIDNIVELPQWLLEKEFEHA